MNTEIIAAPHPTTPATTQQSTPEPVPSATVEDHFVGEELGERQIGVCTLGEGCTSCQ